MIRKAGLKYAWTFVCNRGFILEGQGGFQKERGKAGERSERNSSVYVVRDFKKITKADIL